MRWWLAREGAGGLPRWVVVVLGLLGFALALTLGPMALATGLSYLTEKLWG